jgi:uncharacterized protein
VTIVSHSRRLRHLAVSALALAAAWALEAAPLYAQSAEPASTGLTPFPESDVYKLQVYGDGFADGLNTGIADVLSNTPRVQVLRKHRALGSLVRGDWEDDIKAEEASKDVVHIGVVMFGLMDRQIIRPAGGTRPLSIGSDDWREEYGRRLDRVLKGLKKRGMVVYMVGQPVLRNSGANTQAEMINEIMRQRATATGVKFINIFDQFQDEGGAFTQFGPDVSGNRVKLRDGDGVTFTPIGYKQLAFYVEKELRRDIEQAAVDRTVPLAGDETEQRRVNPAKQVTAGGPGAWKGSVTIGGQSKSAVQPQVPVAPNAVDSSGDQKSDNGRVSVRTLAANGREETATIEILRPAIPAAVIALVTRREASADKASQPGEAVVEEIGGGLTVVNSVSALGDGTVAAGRRKGSPTQSPFYTVLIKGERPTMRAGRADDFAWPRQDGVVAPDASTGRAAPGGLTPGPGQPAVRPGPGASPNVRTSPAPAPSPAATPSKSGQKG